MSWKQPPKEVWRCHFGSNHVFFNKFVWIQKFTYCQIFDVLPPVLQQQIQAKIPTTTAKQHKRMKVRPKYDKTPHSHPRNSFGEASSTGGLRVGMAALAFCEFLTEKGDALVTVAFQLAGWELQAVITYERIYYFWNNFNILFIKLLKNSTIYESRQVT